MTPWTEQALTHALLTASRVLANQPQHCEAYDVDNAVLYEARSRRA